MAIQNPNALSLENLEPQDVQASHDVYEGILAPKGLRLGDLGSEGRPTSMAEYRLVAGHTIGCRGEKVRGVKGESVDLPQSPIPKNGSVVSRKGGIFQIGLLDEARHPDGDENPSTRFRDVLLIEDGTAVHDVVKNVCLINGLRKACGPQAIRRRLHACGKALILGVSPGCHRHEAIRFDGDLHLLTGFLCPLVEEIDVGLHIHHVVKFHIPVVTLVDGERSRNGSRSFSREGLAHNVFADGDRGDGSDQDGITILLDLALVIGVADLRQTGRIIIFYENFPRPNLLPVIKLAGLSHQ